MVDSTPVPRKIARLHLICDILHNSAASITNAWKFRHEFESRLGGVFDHLCAIHRSFPGRITAETFKKQVLGVVEVWEDWIVFTPDFTNELRRRLDGREGDEGDAGKGKEREKEDKGEEKKVVSKFKAAAFGAVVDEPVVPKSTENVEENIDGEDLDGEQIDDDIDGEAIGAPVPANAEDIDGEALDGDPIDGEAIDGEDIDGAEIEGTVEGTGVQGRVGREGSSGDEMEMDSD